MSQASLNLIDNSSIKGREDLYETVEVDLETILKSWKISLFSFEWLTPEGQIRSPSTLPEKEQEKYKTVLTAYESGKPLERPILGIGVMDNVEIGSRRDVLLTLRAQGVQTLSVHISKSTKQDFMPYL
jgi:hypothetical protein